MPPLPTPLMIIIFMLPPLPYFDYCWHFHAMALLRCCLIISLAGHAYAIIFRHFSR
jgi:hypothetical protein